MYIYRYKKYIIRVVFSFRSRIGLKSCSIPMPPFLEQKRTACSFVFGLVSWVTDTEANYKREETSGLSFRPCLLLFPRKIGNATVPYATSRDDTAPPMDTTKSTVHATAVVLRKVSCRWGPLCMSSPADTEDGNSCTAPCKEGALFCWWWLLLLLLRFWLSCT